MLITGELLLAAHRLDLPGPPFLLPLCSVPLYFPLSRSHVDSFRTRCQHIQMDEP